MIPQRQVYDFSTWTWERDEKGHVKTDPTHAARALRAQPAAQALRALHARRWSKTSAARRGTCSSRLRIARQQQRPRAHDRVRVRGRLDAAHRRRAVHPHRRASCRLLLGNMGRPGGGIMALRGHANIQGATDIPTLYDLLPGYLPMPSALRDEQTLAEYLKAQPRRPAGGRTRRSTWSRCSRRTTATRRRQRTTSASSTCRRLIGRPLACCRRRSR